MPPGSEANDVETFRRFIRPFTPLPPVDRVPLEFCRLPLVEKSPDRSFAWRPRFIRRAPTYHLPISQILFRPLDEPVFFFDQLPSMTTLTIFYPKGTWSLFPFPTFVL